MNRKGFSLVELLAIITILGVIMGIAIVSHQRQVTKTRTEAYKTLVNTARTAAQNKYIDAGLPDNYCTIYNIEDLYTSGYMDKPTDPANNSTSCGGKVYIKPVPAGWTNDIDNYVINVELDCSVYDTNDCKDSGGDVCNFNDEQKQNCENGPLLVQ